MGQEMDYGGALALRAAALMATDMSHATTGAPIPPSAEAAERVDPRDTCGMC